MSIKGCDKPTLTYECFVPEKFRRLLPEDLFDKDILSKRQQIKRILNDEEITFSFVTKKRIVPVGLSETTTPSRRMKKTISNGNHSFQPNLFTTIGMERILITNYGTMIIVNMKNVGEVSPRPRVVSRHGGSGIHQNFHLFPSTDPSDLTEIESITMYIPNLKPLQPLSLNFFTSLLLPSLKSLDDQPTEIIDHTYTLDTSRISYKTCTYPRLTELVDLCKTIIKGFIDIILKSSPYHQQHRGGEGVGVGEV